MITINEITIDEKKYLTGTIGGTPYSIESTDEAKQHLAHWSKEVNAADTFEAVKELEKDAIAYTANESTAGDSIKEILEGDLYYDTKAETYHIKHEGTYSDAPINKFFVDKMIEAADKGLSPKPWLIFWVRLMRNGLYVKSANKVNTIVEYLKASYTDDKNIEKLVEQGYSDKIASALSTFDQISITEEGILAAFKYVRLLTDKFVVEKDEKTGEQTIVSTARYARTLEVDENSGEVTKDELALPTIAEDFVFEPPIMGRGGDSFSCATLGDSEDNNLGHIVKVGKVHALPKGFEQVNTDDSSFGRAGLHLGGYYYVQNFGGKTDYLVDCLVAPEDIGAVADIRAGAGDGAIRCKRYMAVGGHFQVNDSMYHPSKYAAMLDDEWKVAKAEAIKNLKKRLIEEEDKL